VSIVEMFYFEWKSTPEERYDTEMMELARQVLVSAGLVETDTWGGTAFGEFAEGYLRSDNGLAANTTLEKAADVASVISMMVGHPVKVTSASEKES
jgi:hypothetical protein